MTISNVAAGNALLSNQQENIRVGNLRGHCISSDPAANENGTTELLVGVGVLAFWSLGIAFGLAIGGSKAKITWAKTAGFVLIPCCGLSTGCGFYQGFKD